MGSLLKRNPMEKMLTKDKIIKVLWILSILCVIVITLLKSDITWCSSMLDLGRVTCILSFISCFYLTSNRYFKVHKLDIVIILWYLYCCGRIYFGENIPNGQLLILYTFLTSLYFVLRMLFSCCKVDFEIVSSTLLLAVSFEIIYGAIQIYRGKCNNVLFSVTGSFLNPGPYAAYIMFGVVMAMCFLKLIVSGKFTCKYYSSYRICFYVSIVVFGIIMIMIAFSRTGIIIVLCFMMWLFRKYLKKYYKLIMFAFCVFAIILLFLKYGSVMARLFIWYISFKIFLKNWIFGTGINSFVEEYGKVLRIFFAEHGDSSYFVHYIDSTYYAFCDILKIAVEQGIIGVIFAIISILLILKNLRLVSKPLFYGLVSLLLFSFFSYPFELLPFQIIFIICGVMSCTYEGIDNSKLMNVIKYVYPLNICILIVSFTLSSYTSYRIECHNKLLIFNDSRDTSLIKYYYQYYPENLDNRDFLMSFAKMLRMDRRYLDSNAMLRDGLKISNDPIFLDVMGNNYKDMGFYNEALHCYQAAFNTLPNRIYPLYCEMKLYEHINDRKHLPAAAKKVMDFQPKISSQATKEMKREAHKLLYNVKK